MKGAKRLLLGSFAMLIAAEVAVHASRVTDFPLYDADNRIGYIPKPNQSGTFLWRNDWVTNELSMGTARPFSPSAATDVLLLGDSIVFGGNPLRQSERLGPALEKASGWKVWPASAGSWGLQNEATYLVDRPELVRGVDRIVMVLNSADFAGPSQWSNAFDHPREQPLPALPYILQRYALGFERPQAPPALRVPHRDAFALLRSVPKPIEVFLYPTKEERHCEWAPTELRTIRNVKIHCVASDPRWNPTLYRDSIHPSPAGNLVLATILRDALAGPAPEPPVRRQ